MAGDAGGLWPLLLKWNHTGWAYSTLPGDQEGVAPGTQTRDLPGRLTQSCCPRSHHRYCWLGAATTTVPRLLGGAGRAEPGRSRLTVSQGRSPPQHPSSGAPLP